jgi:hypothetical protein
MGEVAALIPPFASPRETAIGTFWAFPTLPMVSSVSS